MALRYSVKRTEMANSNIGLLISKLCHCILKTPNMFIYPTPIQHSLQNKYGIVKRMLAFMHENCFLEMFMKPFRLTYDKH